MSGDFNDGSAMSESNIETCIFSNVLVAACLYFSQRAQTQRLFPSSEQVTMHLLILAALALLSFAQDPARPEATTENGNLVFRVPRDKVSSPTKTTKLI